MSDYTISEGIIYDADGNILGITTNGEAKVEAIQKAGVQFDSIIVDGVDPSKKAEVTTDKRLRTDDRKFTLRTIKSDVDVDLPDDNWVEIFSVNGKGMPVYLWIEFYNGNYEMRLTMDGSVAFQMDNLELATYDLNDRTSVGYVGGAPYRRGTDLFNWHFPDDVYYKTNFRLDARRRTGNNRGIDRFLFIHKEELV